MTAKKKITEDNIIELYMDYVLKNDHQPKSVYAFTKENNVDEADFYKFFGSFDAVEMKIFKLFFDSTMKVLYENEEYQTYDARNKLLSFYFTFFENLTANRSYVVYTLNKNKDNLKKWKALAKLKSAFGNYIDDLDIETLDLREENLNKAQKATIRNSAWIQLLITMKFWMDDSSASFEKTDIFIEKSVNASFELMNIKPIQSLVDLGKFILKENFKTNP
jgi:hypothetical protein